MQTSTTQSVTNAKKVQQVRRGVSDDAARIRAVDIAFDLQITPQTASLLSGPIACPRCHRHGGMLKSQGRIGDKLFGLS